MIQCIWVKSLSSVTEPQYLVAFMKNLQITLTLVVKSKKIFTFCIVFLVLYRLGGFVYIA